MKNLTVKNGFSKVTGRTYHMSGVNMTYSFDTRRRLALKKGANLKAGDTLICDNANGDKRKSIRVLEDSKGNLMDAILHMRTANKVQWKFKATPRRSLLSHYDHS